jgi:uncharacterized protein YndB with AHSA1/START domain
MRWVFGIAGVLVVLVAVVLIIGALLPKAHVASMSARYSAAPDALWKSITNIRAFPEWRSDIARVELLPDEDGKLGWREHGKNDAITYRVVSSEAPRRLVTRIADKGLPYGGTWTYELAPDGSGTRLTLIERGEIYNPIFRFVARFFLGYTSTIDGMLRALGTKHGETVAPEPVAAA